MEGQQELVKKIQKDVNQAKFRLMVLESKLQKAKDQLWRYQKEADPSLVACNKCQQKQAEKSCGECRAKFCDNCVDVHPFNKYQHICDACEKNPNTVFICYQ
jgi:7-cyano-7-deazaguanine synthase in queuosine biosynthesis